MMSVTYFARTTFRNQGQVFGIQLPDRLFHMYLLGKTGTGKSSMLRTMISQDIQNQEGLCLLDPHGDLAESVVARVPAERKRNLIYLNVPDTSTVWHFNPLADVPTGKHALGVAGMVETLKKIWSDEWGPRLEHLVRNVMFTLLESEGATLGDIPRLLTDRAYRQRLAGRVSNTEVRSFWQSEYEGYSPRFRAVVIAPLQNKVGAFLTDPLVRRILTGARSSFSLRSVMDEGKLLVVNLAKGQIGEGPSALLGSLLLSGLALAGLARADTPESERRPFFLYVDEFHTFATLSLATMLSELRKYRLGLVLAQQFTSQVAPDIRDAVLGNAGTIVSFRLGAKDAPLIAQELSPVFDPDDLVSLPNYHIYLRLMIDGEPSKPFSAETVVDA